MIGSKLAHYEITGHMGTGGMGEVYQAADSKLGRSVAIKLIPEAFSHDHDRLARFEHEARVLASLNHPNVAALYGLEESGGRKFLVMELVPGETLAQRIKHGLVPVDEALRIAKEIAEGLEAAHEHGVIHRDLKPANVKITPDGRVKVLDFGLAKSVSGEADATLSESPTLSMAATQQGIILGTAAYMSPEQARGRAVDRRTDVWSLGCVLFEMLTAKQTFAGDSVTDVIASVVKSEPEWTALPSDTPPAARALLRSCLQKDLRRRCQHVGDARIAIEDAIAHPAKLAEAFGPRAPAAIARPLWRRAIPVVVAAIVVGVMASAVTWNLRRPGPAAVIRFPIFLLEEQQVSRFNNLLALSADGTLLAYTASGQLFLRAMAETEARAITAKDAEVTNPVFSPDGKWIAFWSRNDLSLKKIAVTGGMPVTLCKADVPNGVSWHGADIVFAQAAGILRVSESGGEAQVLVPTKPGEVFDSPQLLNGGAAVLFAVAKGPTADRWDSAQVVVQSLPSGDRKEVLKAGRAARYLPTGHLVYAVGGTLLAVPFDLGKLEVRGRAVPVVNGIMRSSNPASTSAAAQFAWSATGTLAYVRGLGSATQQRLALVDRSGTVRPLGMPPQAWVHPRFSPDGTQLVVGSDDGREAAIWIYSLNGGGEPSRLTFEGRNTSPIWTHDGKHVTFQSNREGDLSLFTQPADRSGPAERLAKAEAGFSLRPEAWSLTGTLAFLKFELPGRGDIWMLSQDGGEAKPLAALKTANQRYATFSPDGRWFAYVSTELSSGNTNFQVFVQPFPPTGAKFQVSTDGGVEPLCSPNKKQLFYGVRPSNEVLAVDINAASAFVGKPVPVPGVRAQPGGPGRSYDISPDGKQFVIVLPALPTKSDPTRRPAEQIDIVLNWFEELKQQVPVQ